MILATIDVGTNSVKLLVAEARNGRVRPLEERVTITRLGEGVEKSGHISRPAMDRTLEALVDFREHARSRRAWNIAAVGTRVLRAAKNAGEFVKRCRGELDLDVRVLSGPEEARLAFLGATEGKTGVAALDIGGGSTEIMTLRSAKSWNVGAVTLTERFGDDVEAMAREVRRAVKPGTLPRRLIGIGGAVATAVAIQRKRDLTPGIVHGRRLSIGQVREMRDRLAAMTLEERKHVTGLEPARADIIVAGLTILAEVMEKARFSSMTASARGLRHGLALELASKL